MAVSNLVATSTTSTPTLQRTLTSGTSVSDLPTGKEITAFIISGGGGGGGSGWPGTTSGGAAGGGSGSICQYVFTLPTSRTISYTIGAGGAGGLYNTSTSGNGGKTTFDGIIAFPGLGAGSSYSGYAAHGGGGGGAGGGNAGTVGGAGGVYGSKGQHRANMGSYGGYPGIGRAFDLVDSSQIFYGLVSQGSAGSSFNVNSANLTLAQFGDTYNFDMRLISGSFSSQSSVDFGGQGAKITDWQSASSNNTLQQVTMDYSTGPSPGATNLVITTGYYAYIPSPYSRLNRINLLISAGITLPGGGGGGTGGGTTSAGGLGGGTGGRGAAGNGNGGATAGSVPGGGGGGGGGNTSNVASDGAAGGAGAIYLFWAS